MMHGQKNNKLFFVMKMRYILGTSAQSSKPWSCMRVFLSISMYQFGSHWTDFREIWYLRLSLISVDMCLESGQQYRELYMKT